MHRAARSRSSRSSSACQSRDIAGDSPRRPAAGRGRSRDRSPASVHGTRLDLDPGALQRRGLDVIGPVPRLRIIRRGDQDRDAHLAGEQDPRLAGDLGQHRRADRARQLGARRSACGTGRCARRLRSTQSLDRSRPGPRRGCGRGSRSAAARNRAPGRRSSSRSHWSAGTKRATCCCAQSMPERLAEPGVGAGQRQLVELLARAPARRCRTRRRARTAGPARRRCPRSAPSAIEPLAPRRGLAARPRRGSAWSPRPRSCRRPGSSSLHSSLDAGLAAGGAEDVGQDARGRCCAAIANSSMRDRFAAARRCSISSHKLVEVEQPLGDQEGGDDLRQATTPSSSVRSSATLGPRRLTRRLATLVATISWRRRWARIASACALLHRLREGGEQFGVHRSDRRRASAPRPRPAAPAWTSTARPPARAGSGRDRPAPRRSSSSLRLEPFDLAVEPAAGFEHLDRADIAGQRRRRRRSRRSTAPALCSRLSSSTSSATSSVMLASSVLRLSSVEPPLAHFAVERDLDVDLIVRAIDAGANCR